MFITHVSLTFHAHTCIFSYLSSLHSSFFFLLLTLTPFCFLPSPSSIFTSFFQIYSIIFNNVYVGRRVCAHRCRWSMEGRLSISLELELKAFVSFLMWGLGTELYSFGKVINHSAISPTFPYPFCFLFPLCFLPLLLPRNPPPLTELH